MILAEWQRKLLTLLEEPLPLTPQPFKEIAEMCGVDEEDVITQIHRWQHEGIIRRFGARIVHHEVGFAANGMSVWNVPDERVDEIGALMATYPAVSHCYARNRTASWRFNLFAMVHAEKPEGVHAVVNDIAEKTGITDYEVLFTVKELKKTAPKLFTASPSGGEIV